MCDMHDPPAGLAAPGCSDIKLKPIVRRIKAHPEEAP